MSDVLPSSLPTRLISGSLPSSALSVCPSQVDTDTLPSVGSCPLEAPSAHRGLMPQPLSTASGMSLSLALASWITNLPDLGSQGRWPRWPPCISRPNCDLPSQTAALPGSQAPPLFRFPTWSTQQAPPETFSHMDLPFPPPRLISSNCLSPSTSPSSLGRNAVRPSCRPGGFGMVAISDFS